MSVSACGTITRGTSESIAFTSEPPGAAVTTTKGYACPATPCSLEVDRKDQFDARFTLDGYQPATVAVKSKLVTSGGVAFAGNVIAGGVIGMGVDALTGAPYDHYPNPVSVELIPERPAHVAKHRTRRHRARHTPDS
jgi:hypothetical protein